MSDRAPHLGSVSEADAATFEVVRPRLFGIAYRVLGGAAEAEDVVQDTWIRWHGTNRRDVRDAPAFLATATTRLAINVTQSARARHEAPRDGWLPEPIDDAADPTVGVERDEELEPAVRSLSRSSHPSNEPSTCCAKDSTTPIGRSRTLLELSEVNARQILVRARARLGSERRRPVSAASTVPRGGVQRCLADRRPGAARTAARRRRPGERPTHCRRLAPSEPTNERHTMRLLNPRTLPSAGLLSLRIVVGITFVVHGLDKLGDISATEQLFVSFSIPAPGLMAPFVGVTETVGGLLLIAGLATRLAGAALTVDMAVALATAHAELKFFATEGGIELEALLVGANLALVLAGAGRFSLDDVLAMSRYLPASRTRTRPMRRHDQAPAGRKGDDMTTPEPIRSPGAPDAYEPLSRTEKLEEDASLAALAAAEGLRAVEVAAIVLIGLLVCPPLAILVVVVVVPLLLAALVLGLLAAVLTAPYLLFHHFRHPDGGHLPLLGHRLRRAARASLISRRTGSSPTPARSTRAGDRNSYTAKPRSAASRLPAGWS